MKTNLKKIAASLMAVATITSGAMGISASAANTDDKYFNDFSITPSTSWTRLFQTDSKQDTSYVYLYVSSASRAMRVHTLGISSSDGSKHNCTSNTSGAYCVAGPEYRITNTIYEDSYRKADLEFYSVSGYYGDRISGAWSPDSYAVAGHYYNYV